MINWEKELNSEQLDVVLHGEGPCLVLAGAGSGKTRVITYRVAYLLEQGIKPENILLVTFTNKAAGEMVNRVSQLVTASATPPEPPLGKRGILPWAGTFHHIAYKILRQYAPLLNYKNNFTVLDSDDSEALIKLCAKEFKPINDGQKTCLPAGRFPSASVLQAIISYARNAELAIDEVLDARYPQWLTLGEQIKSIATAYEQKKKEAGAMDFDDLLVNLLRLLQIEKVAEKFSEQFQYVLVDEYQDTNKIQASVIKKLATRHKNILVVGDDAQSIYSFRAADIENILQFEKDYPNLPTGQAGAKIFKLETNYRSSEEILKVANEVIANNIRQYKKELRTINKSGLKPLLVPHFDNNTEAQFIAQKISELVEAGVPEKEIAVLFRAAHHSQRLEMELVRAGVSYDFRGGLRFFERAHVKDVLAYLRILNNLADTASWLRLLLHEEGIGPASANNLLAAIREVKNVEEIKNLGYQILGERAKNGWTNFLRTWEALLEKSKKPAELMEAVLESSYIDFLENEYVDASERLQDLEQLKNFASEYTELEEFLAEASLQEGFSMRGRTPEEKNTSGNKIILSTIHQAKGLEWSAVFLMNLAAGAFPNERALREEGGLEEERRLFYVAVTRAKKHLFLTFPLSGGFGDSATGPSMFLEEIDPRLLDDKSLLRENSTVLDDGEITYVDEEPSIKIKPGSFLRDVEDL